MHLDEERVQRLLHGELEPAADAALRQHLAECSDCRARAAAAEREEADVYDLLRLVDDPPPAVSAATVAARARAEPHRWGRWAAGILLAVGAAGAAYAAPGSPLPGWVQAIVGRIAEAPAFDGPDDRAHGAAGIAVAPGRSLLIIFAVSQTRANPGAMTVSLSDETEVVVRSLNGAATYTSEDVDRLVVDGYGSSGAFEIRIPRDAPRVEIRVGDHRLFLKDGPRVSAEAPADARGLYRLPLTPPDS